MVVSNEFSLNKSDLRQAYYLLYFRFFPRWGHYAICCLGTLLIGVSYIPSKTPPLVPTEIVAFLLGLYIIVIVAIELYIVKYVRDLMAASNGDTFTLVITETSLEVHSKLGRGGKSLMIDLRTVRVKNGFILFGLQNGLVVVYPTNIFKSNDDLNQALSYFRLAGVKVIP